MSYKIIIKISNKHDWFRVDWQLPLFHEATQIQISSSSVTGFDRLKIEVKDQVPGKGRLRIAHALSLRVRHELAYFLSFHGGPHTQRAIPRWRGAWEWRLPSPRTQPVTHYYCGRRKDVVLVSSCLLLPIWSCYRSRSVLQLSPLPGRACRVTEAPHSTCSHSDIVCSLLLLFSSFLGIVRFIKSVLSQPILASSRANFTCRTGCMHVLCLYVHMCVHV